MREYIERGRTKTFLSDSRQPQLHILSCSHSVFFFRLELNMYQSCSSPSLYMCSYHPFWATSNNVVLCKLLSLCVHIVLHRQQHKCHTTTTKTKKREKKRTGCGQIEATCIGQLLARSNVECMSMYVIVYLCSRV